MIPEETKLYFTVKQIAKRWQVSHGFVRRIIKDESLSVTRFGRALRVTIEEIQRFEEDARRWRENSD